MNGVFMTGRLTRDAEMKPVGDNNVISFSIANDDESKKQQDGSYENIVSFFNCEFWSKSGKMAMHLLKGKAVTITGALKQDRWQDKEGQNRSVVKIKCSKVEPHVYEKAAGGGSDFGKQEPNANLSFGPDDINKAPF